MRRRLGDAVAVLLLPLPAVILTIRLRARGLSCGVIVNPLDVRLINYLLEWGYQHLLRGQFPDTGLWSPPFFYPTTHALGYSDTFISSYPFYFAGRILGASPAAALLAYQLLQLALTAVVAYLCARWIGLARLPSFLCAQCFAWGWPRYNQLAHLQFASGWVVPLFYASLYLAWRQRRPWLLALAAWTVCAAFYTSVYVAYFLLLTSAIAALLIAFQLRREPLDWVRAVFERIRSWRWALAALWIAAVAAPLLLMVAGVYGYRQAARGWVPEIARRCSSTRRASGPGSAPSAMAWSGIGWRTHSPPIRSRPGRSSFFSAGWLSPAWSSCSLSVLLWKALCREQPCAPLPERCCSASCWFPIFRSVR